MANVNFPVALLLRQYMKEKSLTQSETAGILGISQPYLSRILSGTRGGVSRRVVERVVELLGVAALVPFAEDLDRFSMLYERGLVLLGAGDLVTAEVCFARAAQIPEPRTADALELRARSQAKLAGIRRDHDRIEGPEGAIALYEDALVTHADLGHLAAEREITFMLGACAEMQKRSGDALRSYEDLVRSVEPADDPWLAARLQLRSGALLTKLGELLEAEKRLMDAVSMGAHLEEPGPFSFASEKLAIVLVRNGDIDGAWEILQHVELGPADYLRRIQNLCVRATVFAKAQDSVQREAALVEARALANDHDFGHQLRYVDSELARLEREG